MAAGIENDEGRGRSPDPLAQSDRHIKLEKRASSGLSSLDDHSRSTSARGSVREDQNINKFPPLHNNQPTATTGTKLSMNGSPIGDEGTDDESAVAEPFQRTSSPTTELKRNGAAIYEKVGDQGVCKMHKFSLYETATRYYIVGADVMDQRFRILKIDRTADSGNLSIAEDEIVYTEKEMSEILNAVDDGNKSTGGMKLKSSTWGLLGFIRFTGAYYMLLITKRSQVAMIGGHYVYQIDGTELVPLVTTQNSRFKPDVRNTEESRFLGILNNLDLSRSFYYSYSYDITRTLQHNIAKEREALAHNVPYPHQPSYNAMFIWNHYLLQPAAETLKNTYDWCLPIIHGYIDQAGIFTLPYPVKFTDSRSPINIWTDSLYHNNCEAVTIFCRRSVSKARCE
jgi:phosphatidylinositol 3,5-bisphosphate 5-phosphatase